MACRDIKRRRSIERQRVTAEERGFANNDRAIRHMQQPMPSIRKRSRQPTIGAELRNTQDRILMNNQRTIASIRTREHLPLTIASSPIKSLLRIRRLQVELVRLNPDLQQVHGFA